MSILEESFFQKTTKFSFGIQFYIRNKGAFNAPTYLINLECGVVIRDGYQLPEPSFHLTTHTIRASRLVEHNLSGGDRWGQVAPA